MLTRIIRITCSRFATIIFGLFLTFGPVVALCQQQQDESSRQIVLDRFNKARPADAPVTITNRPRNRGNSAAMRRPVYRRTGPGIKLSAGLDSEDIGVTVWRLRPARQTDQGGRLLVIEGAKQTQLTPERIEADTTLSVGDRVRLTVESPRPGYLYIIDREQYADGTFGQPMMIFPTLRTRDGDNRVRPGKLIDIPAQEDEYSYFTAQPAGDRRDQVAEVLTVILLTNPLQVPIGPQPAALTANQFSEWEKLWGGTVERLELIGGAGQTWTDAEKAASAVNGRQLTQAGPPPQTVYRIGRKAGGPLLVTVPLRYAR
ncbi:MAG: DUF4384 domain-containing protein [Pyrinomonadaceae bacterium]